MSSHEVIARAGEAAIIERWLRDESAHTDGPFARMLLRAADLIDQLRAVTPAMSPTDWGPRDGTYVLVTLRVPIGEDQPSPAEAERYARACVAAAVQGTQMTVVDVGWSRDGTGGDPPAPAQDQETR